MSSENNNGVSCAAQSCPENCLLCSCAGCSFKRRGILTWHSHFFGGTSVQTRNQKDYSFAMPAL